MKKQDLTNANFMSTTVGSDHLLAVINYALEQFTSSGGEINPLAFGEQTAPVSNDFETIENILVFMAEAVQAASGREDVQLALVATNRPQFTIID